MKLDALNVIMNIFSKGTQRTISFESQLVIANNTEFPITLCFDYQHQAMEEREGGQLFQQAQQNPS